MADLVFIGLGANLGDRRGTLGAALAALQALSGLSRPTASSLYETAPVGRRDQPLFLNAVVRVLCDLPPLELLARLQALERRHHRVRSLRWGPRTLDLDLLLWPGLRLADERLQLPHPRLTERAFVLVPLLELAPDLVHPGTGLPLRIHRRRLPAGQALRRVGPFTPRVPS